MAEAPAKRLHKGDYLIYYSPKTAMNGVEYKKFTTLGHVIDDGSYQVDMGNGFSPYRRDIQYFDVPHIDVQPIVHLLPCVKNKVSWGLAFRYGLLHIDTESFTVIARRMGYVYTEEAVLQAL